MKKITTFFTAMTLFFFVSCQERANQVKVLDFNYSVIFFL